MTDRMAGMLCSTLPSGVMLFVLTPVGGYSLSDVLVLTRYKPDIHLNEFLIGHYIKYDIMRHI